MKKKIINTWVIGEKPTVLSIEIEYSWRWIKWRVIKSMSVGRNISAEIIDAFSKKLLNE